MRVLATLMLVVLVSCDNAPSDRQIAWARGNSPRLFRMGLAGQPPTSLLADSLLANQTINFPDWSPDGSRFAFVATGDDGTSIYVVDADGTSLTELTTQGLPNPMWPAWSPDGREIAFVAGPSFQEWDLFLINADGSGLQRLTSGESMENCPRWSPDGSKILYTYVQADTFRLMVLDRRDVCVPSSSSRNGGRMWRLVARRLSCGILVNA